MTRRLRRAALLCAGAALLMPLAGGGPARAQAGETPGAPLNPMAATDRNALTGFREKPLFDPSRRRRVVAPPPETEPAPPPVATAPPSPPPSLKLLGILAKPEGDLAIVRHRGEGKVRRLHNGDTIDDWTLTIVSPLQIALSRDTEKVTVQMFGSSRAPAPKPQNLEPLHGAPPVQVPEFTMEMLKQRSTGASNPPAPRDPPDDLAP